MEYHQPTYPQHNHKVSLSTQSKLIDSFQYYQVPEFYQNVFINHLKNQQDMLAKLCMQEEIEALSNNSSYIQSFMRYCVEKEKYEGHVREIMSYKKKSYESQNVKFIKICELVGYLRDINYKCAYFLLKIREKYEQNVDINRSNEKYYYNGFAMQLDSFRKELLKTQISKYIDFDPEYDPFFMNLQQKQCHIERKCNEALQMLMQFAIQDSYKYLKMGKLLMDWIFMHTRKKKLDKSLDRIDLPELRINQRYVQYDNLKEDMLRDKLRDKVDNSSNHIKRNRGILEVYNQKTGYEGHRNRVQDQDNKILSLQNYEKQRVRKERQIQRKSYIDDNLNKLLVKNTVTPQKPPKNHSRIKSESSSYDPEYSMIGKIRRFKISRSRYIQNSPNTYNNKRSETLPFLPREERYSEYYRNGETRAILSPKDEYDRKYDYKEERLRNLSREKIKLQQINAYQITIGKPNQTAPTVRRQLKGIESSNQPVKNEKTLDRAIAKQLQTNRYEQKQNMPSKKQNDPQKNQSLKKKSVTQQNPNIESALSKPSNQSRKIQQNKLVQEQKSAIKKETEKAIQKAPQSQSNKSGKTKNQIQQTKRAPKKQQNKIKGQDQSDKKQERRQIKMRIGKYTLQNFRQYFDSYQIHKDYVKLYDKQKISKELQFQQTYIIQFLINNSPGALGIIYLIAKNKLVLRVWALDNKQEAALSYPLLKKMIEYVQKSTTNQIIYYKGGEFAELIKAGFIKKKEELFQRKRTTDPKEVDLQFQQCLSVKCSHIKFVQKQKEDILVSAEIQNFTVQNSKIADCLVSISEGDIPQKLKTLITIKHKIHGFKPLNKILQTQDFDSYQASSKITVQSIDLSLLNFLSNFSDSFSVADGFIKFYGNIVKQSSNEMICSIKLSKNNGRVCFCKGYKSALQVLKNLKPQTQKKVQFWVPMFNKKLYGRFKNYKSISNEVCYANWDISISWQDEIQGALRYTKKIGLTFQQCSFYVCIELQGTLLYTFEVNEEDYIL